EEPAEAVERAEQDEEVRRLQSRRAVAEGHGRDEQREPAQLQREQELRDELPAVRVRRSQGRDDRLPRENHHVADLLEEALGRQECSIGDGPDHLSLPWRRRSRGAATAPRAKTMTPGWAVPTGNRTRRRSPGSRPHPIATCSTPRDPARR